MRPSSHRRVLGVTASLVIAALSPAIAQEQSHTAKGPETSLISRVLTGKERLGRKWMDEQRMDSTSGGPSRDWTPVEVGVTGLMDVEVITTFATRSGRLFHGAAGCARAMGMQIQIMNARTRREIDAAFQTIARERHVALLVGSDTFFRGRGAASLALQ